MKPPSKKRPTGFNPDSDCKPASSHRRISNSKLASNSKGASKSEGPSYRDRANDNKWALDSRVHDVLKAQTKLGQSKSEKPALILTCEHAGNFIPQSYRALFKNAQGVLKTHRAWDPGAFEIAHALQRLSKSPFYFTKLSRLIVDMNRSAKSTTLLSKWTKSLNPTDQRKIVTDFYLPYRESIYSEIDANFKKSKRLVHVGIHSFSPYLDSSRRNCQFGILFDPASPLEVEFVHALEDRLNMLLPKLNIRTNFPYRGDADGLTTDLRAKYDKNPGRRYAGIEFEFNQAFLKRLIKDPTAKKAFVQALYFSIESALTAIS